MKTVLHQRTSAGIISIAQSADRRFHVMWKGQSLGDAETVIGAITLASEGQLQAAQDGTDFRKVPVSWRAADWYVAT